MRIDLLAWTIAAGMGLVSLGGCQTARVVASRSVGWIPGLHGSSQASEGTSTQKIVKTRGLELNLRLAPNPVSLAETRQVEVTLRLTNRSSRFVQLEFPTTQRFEMLLRDAGGKTLVQWSEDQAFEPTPGVVGINPGEHLEYRASLSTRDLQPGGRYTVTAFFPSREDLKAELPLAPQK
jgi:hypothetical protein